MTIKTILLTLYGKWRFFNLKIIVGHIQSWISVGFVSIRELPHNLLNKDGYYFNKYI